MKKNNWFLKFSCWFVVVVGVIRIVMDAINDDIFSSGWGLVLATTMLALALGLHLNYKNRWYIFLYILIAAAVMFALVFIATLCM